LLISYYHVSHSLVYLAVVFGPIIAHSVIHPSHVSRLEVAMLIVRPAARSSALSSPLPALFDGTTFIKLLTLPGINSGIIDR